MPNRVFQAGSAALTLLTTAASGTGGWAVITVADLPESLTVGKPVTIEYLVRQHGQNLLTDLSGSVIATACRLSAEYVASVLADPTKAVVPINGPFRMPNLSLNPAEIAALTAFLTKPDRAVAAGK